MRVNELGGVVYPRTNRGGYRKNKEACRERDHYECQICYSKDYLHVHHIVPRVDGGMDDLDNLVTLCARCHKKIEYGIDPILGQRYLASLIFRPVSVDTNEEPPLQVFSRICPVCQQPFTTTRIIQQMCSPECVREASKITRIIERKVVLYPPVQRKTRDAQPSAETPKVVRKVIVRKDPSILLKEVYEKYEYLDAPLSGDARTVTAKIACDLWQAVKAWRAAQDL